jgi:aminopeptidase-like protein
MFSKMMDKRIVLDSWSESSPRQANRLSDSSKENAGREMHALAAELFPLPRSLTGNGVRDTLKILRRHLPKLQIHEVPTGTKCFDWVVPPEWNCREAFILTPNGDRIADFAVSNLHVVGYSTPVDATVSLEELQQHLYSLPEQPDAIPYITSYYEERWGFCLTHRQRESLGPGKYTVRIDSKLAPGSLTYGEFFIPSNAGNGQEIFLSTYVCHPSLANNELSGPVVTTFLAKWIAALPQRNFSYRIVFIPETIGSITYLSRNLADMKKRIVAGFNVSCVGDDRAYSYLPSRSGDTPADRVALHVLKHISPGFVRYTFLDRGSDERQYCSPGVDLPVATVMRTKYGAYPEYHTSLDDLNLITPSGLSGGFSALAHCILCLEKNETLQTTVLGEPQLGQRGLYPTLSSKGTMGQVKTMMNLLAYCDGKQDLLNIAETIGVPMWECFQVVETLKANQLLRSV